MPDPAPPPPAPRWLERSALGRLLEAVGSRGFRLLGPVVRDEALALAPVTSAEDLATGWRDDQAPGRYRLERSGSPRVFDVVHGPGGIKPHAFAPREVLLQIDMEGPGRPFRATAKLPDGERLALLGVRPCDLAALAVQDRIFLRDLYPDAHYDVRRSNLFLIAVNCTRSVATCFCTSMGTGPRAESGYDLSLTEGEQGFIVRAGSEAGVSVLEALGLAEAGEEALEDERRSLEACASSMVDGLEVGDLRDLLYANLEHPRWDDVAGRCLSCANCTMVCPTCFCHDERDEPELDGLRSTRVREWDSCFSREHAQVHGLNFRPHIRERYRQWLVHKLASWEDQFGTSGCVGCGRCISWCPAGIDIREEVRAIRGSSS